MWQSPSQRARSASRKSEREKNRKPLHIKRTVVQLEMTQGEPNPVEVRLVLNDLSAKGAGLFSPKPLTPGQEVKLNIAEPFNIQVKAKVIWCQEHNANSHVLSDRPFSYRVGAEFILTSPDEKDNIKKFCEEIEKNHLYSLRAV